MPLRIVQSKQNGRLKQLRRALTGPGRDGSNLAGIEGPNLIEEALLADVTRAAGDRLDPRRYGRDDLSKVQSLLKIPSRVADKDLRFRVDR